MDLHQGDIVVKMCPRGRCAAVVGPAGDWTAYLENDTTRRGGNSARDLADHGTKMSEDEAVDIFSEFWQYGLDWRA